MEIDNATLSIMESLIVAYDCYIGTGVFAFISNVAIIATFLTDRELRNRYHMLVVLASAELVNALATAYAGVVRNILIKQAMANGVMPITVTAWDCAIGQPYPALIIIGSQWPAIITLLIGIERLFAVYRPFTYRLYITISMKNYIVLFSALIVFVSIASAYLAVYISYANTIVLFICITPQTFSTAYQAFDGLFIICGHTFGFIFTLMAQRGAIKSLVASASNQEMQKLMRRELNRIRPQLAITILSVLLIALPHLLLLDPFGIFDQLQIVQLTYCYVAFCSNSCVNFIAYLVINREFRHHLTRRCFNHVASVSNTNAIGTTTKREVPVKTAASSAAYGPFMEK